MNSPLLEKISQPSDLKKLDKESLAIIRSNAEILRARDTLEEQKAG